MICNFLLCPNAIVSRIFCACYCWSLIQHFIFLAAQICNCVAQIPEFSCALFEQLMLCFLSGNYAHHFYRKFSLHQTQWAVWLLHFSKGCEHEQKAKMHVAFFFFSSSFSLFLFVCLLRVGLSSFEIHRRSAPELWQRKLTNVHCGLKLQVKCIKLSPRREISCKATEEYLSMLIHLRWCVQTLHISRHFLTSEFWTACFARGSYSSCEEYGVFWFLSVCIPYG